MTKIVGQILIQKTPKGEQGISRQSKQQANFRCSKLFFPIEFLSDKWIREEKKSRIYFFSRFHLFFIFKRHFHIKATVFCSLVYLQETRIPEPRLGLLFTCFPVFLQVATELDSLRSLNETFDKLSGTCLTTKNRQRLLMYY